jgi:hypothetical protein
MDINDSYLNQTYENFANEQMKLMQTLKSKDDEETQQKIQKQLTMLNSLMIQIIRYRNLRNKKYCLYNTILFIFTGQISQFVFIRLYIICPLGRILLTQSKRIVQS